MPESRRMLYSSESLTTEELLERLDGCDALATNPAGVMTVYRKAANVIRELGCGLPKCGSLIQWIDSLPSELMKDRDGKVGAAILVRDLYEGVPPTT